MIKTYVFENVHGVVARKEAYSMDEAIKWFKATYLFTTFSYVYEQ